MTSIEVGAVKAKCCEAMSYLIRIHNPHRDFQHRAVDSLDLVGQRQVRLGGGCIAHTQIGSLQQLLSLRSQCATGYGKGE